MYEIKIDNLTKRYGQTIALDNVSLTLERGKIYGLLGRNGAGKTTLLNLMTNKIVPTSGEITIAGQSVEENDAVLNRIYHMSEETLYPPSLRVREVFRWSREFYPKFDPDYAEQLAQRFELNTRKRVKELSTGYTLICKAILTLASNAEILLFDEPVLGLDANHRDMLYKEILANYIDNPKTVIVSTHLIDEVADVLEEVIIIKQGQIILKRPLEELLVSAYTVSGEISQVEKYIAGKKCVGGDILGNFKSVIVFDDERNQSLAKSLNLELGKVELQKLFIGLTNA